MQIDKNIIFNKTGIFEPKEIECLVEMAKNSSQKISRINYHPDDEHKLHQMLICFIGQISSKLHRHRDKDEIFHLLKGEAEVFLYNANASEITQTIILNLESPMLRISKDTWHRIQSRSDLTLVHEICSGPFDKSQMQIKTE